MISYLAGTLALLVNVLSLRHVLLVHRWYTLAAVLDSLRLVMIGRRAIRKRRHGGKAQYSHSQSR